MIECDGGMSKEVEVGAKGGWKTWGDLCES